MDILFHLRIEPSAFLSSLLRKEKNKNIQARTLFIVSVLFILLINHQNTWASHGAEPDLLGSLYLKQCVYSADGTMDNESSLFIKCCTKELNYCVVCPKDQATKCSIHHDINTVENLVTVINKKDASDEEKISHNNPSTPTTDPKNKTMSETTSGNTTTQTTASSLKH